MAGLAAGAHGGALEDAARGRRAGGAAHASADRPRARAARNERWWADAADEFALFDERDDHVDATVWRAAAANETEAAPTATLPAAPKAHLALML